MAAGLEADLLATIDTLWRLEAMAKGDAVDATEGQWHGALCAILHMHWDIPSPHSFPGGYWRCISQMMSVPTWNGGHYWPGSVVSIHVLLDVSFVSPTNHVQLYCLPVFCRFSKAAKPLESVDGFAVLEFLNLFLERK